MCDLLKSISPNFTVEDLNKTLNRITGCDDVTIKSVDLGNNSEKKGDSYLSVIYRLTVEANGKSTEKEEESITLNMIVKGFPKNLSRRKLFRSVDFFETEINFYSNVWPLMKKLKETNKINELDEVPLHLTSYCDGKNDYIALKDISFDGYTTIQRGLGVDRDYASLFLKLLANFHALSIAARQKIPEFEQVARSLKETYFDERFRDWYSGFMYKKLYKVIQNAVKTQLAPKYLEKVDELYSSDLYGRLCKLAKGPESKLLAVIQGDAWIPNFLVKIENGKPVHAVLIDFQLARYSNITCDLVHFLYCCISQDLILNHFDDLVEEYHGYLSKRIGELGLDPNFITLDDLKDDIQKNSLIGFAMAVESIVMGLLDDDEVADLDAIQGDVPLEAVWDISPFDDSERNEKVAFLIKHAVDKGII